KSGIANAYGRLPLSFEANEGQTDARVKFLSRGNGYTLMLTANESILSLKKRAPEKDRAVLRMKLAGANPAARVAAEGELSGKSNYFIGGDPEKWRRNVPNFE